MGENWKKVRKEITQEIKEFGSKASLVKVSHGVYDVLLGKKVETKTSYTVYILFGEYIQEDSLAVGRDEFLGRMTFNKNIEIEHNHNLRLEIGDEVYRVKMIKPVMPGGVILFFKVICELLNV
jgi:hypothetical protein